MMNVHRCNRINHNVTMHVHSFNYASTFVSTSFDFFARGLRVCFVASILYVASKCERATSYCFCVNCHDEFLSCDIVSRIFARNQTRICFVVNVEFLFAFMMSLCNVFKTIFVMFMFISYCDCDCTCIDVFAFVNVANVCAFQCDCVCIFFIHVKTRINNCIRDCVDNNKTLHVRVSLSCCRNALLRFDLINIRSNY